jgi:two-component system, LytTR family, sensor kinase
MLTAAAPDLLHVVGYLTGAALYAMLLVMVIRASRPDRLMVVTAAFGLAWNVGELLLQGLRRLAVSDAQGWIEAASYSALGALAAVVIHSVTREPAGHDRTTSPRQRLQRVLPIAAYAVAASAAILHFVAAGRDGIVPSRSALVLLTFGVVALAPALVLTTHRQANGRRALWMTALSVFAVSALHLGNPHSEGESWALELIGHHASIPLAFAILYEDYRFALADLFLKRALTLIALVTIVFVAWSTVIPPDAAGTADFRGPLLALWIGTALLFPWLRRGVSAFVDWVVLRRANYSALLERISSTLQDGDAEDTLLDRVCEMLGPAISAESVSWEKREPGVGLRGDHELPVLTTDPPHYAILVGPLVGGRRLLSDDLAMLDRVATLTARRIDALRLTRERYERVLREREMRTLATEAELKALRSQINPHFLFNALTTIGYLIQHAPARALETLLRLTTLLRSVLRSEGEFTTLGHERELIKCYLQIERERFEERLQVSIDIPDELEDLPIPSLIVQPLVENAIKHGVANARAGGTVEVTARLATTSGGAALSLRVRNTGSPLRGRTSAGGGVGLRNVQRRLECYYGDAATLDLRSDADGSTLAELRLPATIDEPAVPTHA